MPGFTCLVSSSNSNSLIFAVTPGIVVFEQGGPQGSRRSVVQVAVAVCTVKGCAEARGISAPMLFCA